MRPSASGRAYLDPRAQIRETDRQHGREEAARIREIVPSAPSIDELLIAASTTRVRPR